MIQREGRPLLSGAGEPSLPPTAMHCAALPAGGEVGGQEGRLGAPQRSGLAVSTTDSTRTQAEGKGGHQPQTEEGKLLEQRKGEARAEAPGRLCQTACGPPHCTLTLVLSNELKLRSPSPLNSPWPSLSLWLPRSSTLLVKSGSKDGRKKKAGKSTSAWREGDWVK